MMVQIAIGIEGTAIAVGKEGAAAECLDKLGGGLNLDQLRWIFSNLSETELIQEEGLWNPKSVPFSDSNALSPKLWSELHSECQPVAISLVGPPVASKGFDYFKQEMLTATNETVDTTRYTSSETTEGLAASLYENGAAIGFLGIRFVLSEEDREILENLKIIGLREGLRGSFVSPTVAAYDETLYALATKLYMNLNQDETSLINTRPFVDYGFSEEGTKLLIDAGFWPLHESDRIVMDTKAQTPAGIPMDHIKENCGPAEAAFSIAGSSTVFPIAELCKLFFCLGEGDASFSLVQWYKPISSR